MAEADSEKPPEGGSGDESNGASPTRPQGRAYTASAESPLKGADGLAHFSECLLALFSECLLAHFSECLLALFSECLLTLFSKCLLVFLLLALPSPWLSSPCLLMSLGPSRINPAAAAAASCVPADSRAGGLCARDRRAPPGSPFPAARSAPPSVAGRGSARRSRRQSGRCGRLR